MKHGFGLLILMVFCALLTAACAEEVVFAEYAEAICAWNDRVYSLKDRTLSEWELQGNRAALLSARHVDLPNVGFKAIFADADGVYGLDCESGILYNLSNGAKRQLEWGPMLVEDDEGTYPANMTYAFLNEGKLNGIVRNWNINEGMPFVASWDVESGRCTAFKSKNIQAISSYINGKYLAVTSDDLNAFDENGKLKPAMLCEFDPKSDTLNVIGELKTETYGISGLHYDPQADAIYWVKDNVIYRMDGKASNVSGYLSMPLFGYACAQESCVMGENIIANLPERGLVVGSVRMSQLPLEVLNIYGGRDDYAHRAAVERLGVPVTLQVSSSNAQDLIQKIISRDDMTDLYCIDLTYLDFKRVMEKGFCLDLSSSESLAAYFSSVYPYIQEGLSAEGTPYAIPIEIQAMVYLNASEIKGLIADGCPISIPDSFMGLCDFITEWNDKYSEEYDDYQPFLASDYREAMTEMAFSLYGDYLVQTGQSPTFNTKVFREIMEKVEGIHTDNIDFNIDWTGDMASAIDAEEDMFSKRELFSRYDGISLPYLEESPMLLSLLPDTPAGLTTNVTVFFINPHSKHTALAIRYLEAYVDALSIETRIMLCPNANEPIWNESYDEQLAAYDEQIELLKTQYEDAEPIDRQDIEMALAGIQQSREHHMLYGKYAISPENIQVYRELMQSAFLAKDNLLYSKQTENSEMIGLLNRYMDGQLNLEQFIDTASRQLTLMEMEDEGL